LKYKVKVKLNEDFVKVNDNEIIIGIKAKPQKGKANRELIKKLTKHFRIPSSRVRIISGMKSKNKIIEIE
jgi:uncharacterized protein (TIGR00251 family)